MPEALLVDPSGSPVSSTPETDWRLVQPFPEKRWPRVWVWVEEFRNRVMDDFAPQTLEEFVAQRMQLAPMEATFGVERGGELGGLIVIQPANPYLVSAHCLFKKSFWGADVTLAACRMVFADLFEKTEVQKIQAVAFADNHQILALVRKLGGDKEGHLYKNTLRDGKPTDQMILGIHKADFLEALAEQQQQKPEVTQ
jgi:RimJ/RimL family protein N-acetyltransferase